MAGRGKQRTTFDKLQRERARQQRQAEKRERRIAKRAAARDTDTDGTDGPSDEERATPTSQLG